MAERALRKAQEAELAEVPVAVEIVLTDRLLNDAAPAERHARFAMTLTVDLNHHAIPDFYRPASNEDGNAAGGITPPRWSLDGCGSARRDRTEGRPRPRRAPRRARSG
jgi:hypothetical protein